MKNLVNKKSRESNLPIQQLYGLYAMDRLVLKLSKSTFAGNLIVKGGFLLATDLGVSLRATRDLDFTVRNLLLSKNIMNDITDIIISKHDNSPEYFVLKALQEMREDFVSSGYNLKLIYHNGSTKIPISIDITSGEDLVGITDKKQFRSIFTAEEYELSSYSIEQILSDKLYTVLAYGNIDDTNSRMKDYYDLYMY